MAPAQNEKSRDFFFSSEEKMKVLPSLKTKVWENSSFRDHVTFNIERVAVVTGWFLAEQ